MVYKYAVKKKVLEWIEDDDNILDKERYAETFMNFENISFICHHGKATAIYLIELCKHFDVEYFVINDWDFEEDDLSKDCFSTIHSLEELRGNDIYKNRDRIEKGMLTTNWNLNEAVDWDYKKIHFNTKKLETVIGYDSDNKSSIGIWNLINSNDFEVTEELFPDELEEFIGLYEI